METMKLARTRVSFELVEQFLTGGFGAFSSTAPGDLKIHSIFQDQGAIGCYVWIAFYSESNRVREEGELIPEVDPFVFTLD